MKQDDLKEYRKIEKEIEALNNKINFLNRHEYKLGADTVSASAVNFPFNKHSLTISGYGFDYSNDYKKNDYLKKLYSRKKDLDEKFDEIQNFIDSVDDSAVRQIIEYKYIDGLSWAAAARKVYGKPIESTARSVVERFFKKI